MLNTILDRISHDRGLRRAVLSGVGLDLFGMEPFSEEGVSLEGETAMADQPMDASETPQSESRSSLPPHARHGPHRNGNGRVALLRSQMGLADWGWPETERANARGHRIDVIQDTYPFLKAALNGENYRADDRAASNTQVVREQPPDVISLLPRLRQAARLLTKNGDAADKLVELTLERAIAAVNSRDDGAHLEAWLTALLEDTFKRIKTDLRRLFP